MASEHISEINIGSFAFVGAYVFANNIRAGGNLVALDDGDD